MLPRRGLLLLLLAALLAGGCSIDRVEWETSGWPVEQVGHALEEEHHAVDPAVECIQREAQGAEWECRAHSAEGEYHCHVKAFAPKERIYEIHCEGGHAKEGAAEEHEQEPASDEEHGGEEPAAEDDHAETTTSGHEDEPAETVPAHE
jgi:hypothetical protein